MKKTFLTSLFLFPLIGMSQSTPDSVIVYMEVSRVSAGFVKIDDGNGKDQDYIAEDGRILHFNSAVGAVNYFMGQGWKLNRFTQSSGEDNRMLRIYVIEKKLPYDEAKVFFSRGIKSAKKPE